MIIEEGKYLKWIINNGVGKKDKIADSTKSYISYLNSVSKLINEDISRKNLYDEQSLEKIVNRILENGKNIASISKYKTAMRQYVRMVNNKSQNMKLTLSELALKQTKKNIGSTKSTLSSEYKSIFKIPNAVSIKGRTSSITNSFINGVIPIIQPNEKEIDEVLNIFNLSKDKVECVYCGDKSTEWDHLQPLIKNKRFTGFITEIQNLVPACGKCNQSKGNRNWFDWIYSSAKQSPYSRQISDIDERAKRIRNFENWKKTTNINFQDVVGNEKWKEYENLYQKIIKSIEECQIVSNEIKQIIKEKTESE
ncbi:HNH endonuclease [Lacinutrix jangbogonensis]|uniref:HNH endonuclease n=1 Tax=Lacinutrix jangbogonensis TaxID=1469557 RepID=UPI000AA8EE50|nr:HNH endonuclease signature motif containing protein [Lacinutrix jangbogonensis]